MLSTHNISFTKDLVFFECARDLSCEASDVTRALLTDGLAPEEAQRLQSTMGFSPG